MRFVPPSTRPGLATTEFVTFAGAVLAGGESRRMGSDKAFVTVSGVEMVTNAVQALTAAGASAVTVVGGNARRLEDLGLPQIVDEFPGEGPLGGIISALRHFASADDGVEVVVIMACDLVSPSDAAVRSVAAALHDPAVDVVVPVVGDRAQWLHAAWRIGALDSLSRDFASGIRAPHKATQNLTVREIRGRKASWFRDADRPEDLPPQNEH
jgi:molybdenum cofactor guanylyltransferase